MDKDKIGIRNRYGLLDLETFKIYKELFEKYEEKQVVVAIEELSELQKELCKALRGKPDKEHIAEEIADVFIMIEQMGIYFGISPRKINEIIEQKIKRTQERLLKVGNEKN